MIDPKERLEKARSEILDICEKYKIKLGTDILRQSGLAVRIEVPCLELEDKCECCNLVTREKLKVYREHE